MFARPACEVSPPSTLVADDDSRKGTSLSQSQWYRTRRWPLSVAVVAAAAVAMIVVATSRTPQQDTQDAQAVAMAAATGGAGLVVSTRPDRANAKPLSGATVRGKVYVTQTGGADAVTAVAFRLDDALGAVRLVERERPYDFAGGAPDGSAKPFDTATLSDGPHVILADISLKDGTQLGVHARFTVSNATAPTTTSAPTSTSKPTQAPTSTSTAAPTTTTSPPAGGRCTDYPNAGCTGVPKGIALTEVRGDLIASTPGQVVDGKKITGRLYVAADDVIIRNSEIHGGVTGYRAGKDYRFTVTDTLIGAPSGCDGGVGVGSSRYTATRVHIRNFGDGFRDSGDDILIQDSFVVLCSNPGDHSDGVQGYQGGRNVVVRHNTIDQRAAKDVTSPIFFADGSLGAVVQDNLLAGGGYTVRLHGKGFTFTGNQVVKDSWIYGPVSSDCPGVQWSNNRLVTIDADYRVTSAAGTLNC